MRVRSLVLVMLLVALPTAAQSQIGGKNKIRYDRFDWHVYATPHFQISYYDRVEPSLEKLASYAESAYDELARRLNYQILDPIPVLAYATHAEFEQTNLIVGFIPEGVGAFATPVRNRMVLPVDLPDSELQALIQHELTHIFQYEILFQGQRGRAIYRRPPHWFMEGMASYFADDEGSRAKAYMRDAALSDRVPSVAAPLGGYFSYRFGHMVFEFIEDEWGPDGLRDFIFEFRNGLGGGLNRTLRRTFEMEVDEFDAAFRTWLREHYREWADRGTPQEFGRRFWTGEPRFSHETSPVASPSGDLVAAITTYRDDVDVAVFGVPDRRLYANLTKGYTTEYEYIIAQELTVGPDRGRDLAFAPDGNRVAVFGRSERQRELLLLDVHRGGIVGTLEIPLPIDQPMQPAWSPDGRTIAFQAFAEGQSDIFLIDIETGDIRNLTADAPADASPAFAPDGRSIVYSRQAASWAKLVRLELDDPSRREQLTFGPSNEEGAAFSGDGQRLYFASDRDGDVLDIYVLDLANDRLERLTHVITAAINPAPVMTLEGERVIFQSFYRGSWNLYLADPNRATPVERPERVEPPPVEAQRFLPAISVHVDPAQGERVTGRGLQFEDGQALVGVDQDQNLISRTYAVFGDTYGDRRVVAILDSVRSYSNFRLSYFDLEKRLQWGATIFDDRSFYYTDYDPLRERITGREQLYRQTGAALIAQYPFSRYLRVESQLGYIDRSADLPYLDESGEIAFNSFDDQVPFANLGLVGDTVLWKQYGPHAGARWEVTLGYSHDLEGSGALSRDVRAEGRWYLPISRRSEVATRLYAAAADGNRPNVFVFGGLDSLRGVRVRSLAGNRAGYVNLEYRFPLIDQLDSPLLELTGVRGRFFADIGAAWYDIDGQTFNSLGEPDFTFIDDGRLVDGIASYGVGLSVNLFGLPMHWDFVKLWDLESTVGDTEIDFWIGFQF